ncbi:MAG TPA: hypothetical protein VIK91_24240, partial [Nannocystis sp.]
AWAPLCTALAALLKSSRWKVRDVVVGHLDGPDALVRRRTAITQDRLGELTPLSEIDHMKSGWLTRGRVLVLSATHPTMCDLRTVARREPELAAYLALKSFFLHGELRADVDAEIATKAAEARWRRTAT